MALGLGALGPALGPGGLLSLDLVATPTIPVPSGIWGMGPELPRRVPYGAAIAWLSHVVGGAVAMKVVIVLAIAAAFAGAARLASSGPWPAQVVSGAIYAASPFVLTRVGAGHIGVVLGVAVLPWALPALVRPADAPKRALLWSTALALAGFAGGSLAIIVLVVGAIADRGRRLASTVAIAAVSQLPWIVPGVVVVVAGPAVHPVAGFGTRLHGFFGPLQLVAGHGFWRAGSQVGATGAGVAVLGGVLLALAVAGVRQLPAAWATRATVVATIGFCVAAASGAPGVARVYRAATSAGPGLLLRESERALPLFLVWLAPCAALGALQLASGLRRQVTYAYVAVPLACAAALAVPGLWGVGGRLDPVQFPPGWARVRAAVHRDPGPVLALPWHQYLDLSFADDRRVLNPLPDYLGGDVLVSSDPELDGGTGLERADRRERAVLIVLDRLHAGRSVASSLRRLGITWVVLVHEVDWVGDRGLSRDTGLIHRLATDSVDLYRVRNSAPRPRSRLAGGILVLLGDLITLSSCVGAVGWLRRCAACRTVTLSGHTEGLRADGSACTDPDAGGSGGRPRAGPDDVAVE